PYASAGPSPAHGGPTPARWPPPGAPRAGLGPGRAGLGPGRAGLGPGRIRKGRRGGPASGPPLTPGAWCLVPRATRPLARVERPWHGLEVHVTAAGGGRCLVLLRLLDDHCLGGEEETGYRSGILQRGPGDLGRVDDPRLEHVDVLAGRGVEAVSDRERLHLLDHHAAFEAGVHGDLL